MLHVLKAFDLADVTVEITTSSKGHSQIDVLHVRIEHENVSREVILAATLPEVCLGKFP